MGSEVDLFYMKILKNGDHFWNYIKNEMIEVSLAPCPKCGSESILVEEFANDNSTDLIGHGYARCTSPNCGCKTRMFYTDSGYSNKYGIEKSQEKWNNKDVDWFE